MIAGVLLAVGVIYHAVDMDLFAHVHCEDEREPASAEVRAGLNPANTQRQIFHWNIHLHKNLKNHKVNSVSRTPFRTLSSCVLVTLVT